MITCTPSANGKGLSANGYNRTRRHPLRQRKGAFRQRLYIRFLNEKRFKEKLKERKGISVVWLISWPPRPTICQSRSSGSFLRQIRWSFCSFWWYWAFCKFQTFQARQKSYGDRLSKRSWNSRLAHIMAAFARFLASKAKKNGDAKRWHDKISFEAKIQVKMLIRSGYVSKKPRIHVLLMLKYEARLWVNFGHDMGQMTVSSRILRSIFAHLKSRYCLLCHCAAW